MDVNKIYLGNAIDVLAKEIPDESIDLIVTSCPYDNLRKYNGFGEEWSRSTFEKIATELKRVLKKGGVIVSKDTTVIFKKEFRKEK